MEKSAFYIFRLIRSLEGSLLETRQKLVTTNAGRTKRLASDKAKVDKCPDRSCHKKKSFWDRFKKKEDKVETVSQACCPDPELCIPKLDDHEGPFYNTCGPSLVIQKDKAPQIDVKTDPEDVILDKMLKHPTLKDLNDPMPPFVSAEQRLLELADRKLHPCYKKLMNIPKKPPPAPPGFEYKTRSGPIDFDEIPEHLMLNRDVLEKKNIMPDLKKVPPPQDLLAKLVEIKKNEQPTLEPKGKTDKSDDEMTKKKKNKNKKG